ncbi:MAG: HalOD1 output domain-containing protein [Haloferacaceae archaeon]
MDEQRRNARRETNPDRTGNETASLDDTVDAPTPGGAPDEAWVYETQARYEPEESRDLTTVIVSAIADAEGVPAVDVKSPPLYDVIDVASIEHALFGHSEAERADADSLVEFRYNEYKVRVRPDGWVTVSRRPGGSVAGDE